MSYLKTDKIKDVHWQKNQGNYTVVYAVLGERTVQRSKKVKSVAVDNVSGDIKGHYKRRQHLSHDQKTEEVYAVEVFRIEEEIWNAKDPPEIISNYQEKKQPIEKKKVVSFEVIKQ